MGTCACKHCTEAGMKCPPPCDGIEIIRATTHLRCTYSQRVPHERRRQSGSYRAGNHLLQRSRTARSTAAGQALHHPGAQPTFLPGAGVAGDRQRRSLGRDPGSRGEDAAPARGTIFRRLAGAGHGHLRPGQPAGARHHGPRASRLAGGRQAAVRRPGPGAGAHPRLAAAQTTVSGGSRLPEKR